MTTIKQLEMENQDQDPFETMDREDEEQIIKYYMGQYSPEYIYEIDQWDKKKKIKKKIRVLTYQGILEAARLMGGFRVELEKIRINETEEKYQCLVQVENIKTGEARVGIAEQSKIMTLEDGTTCPDRFALQKAQSKATRNAMRQFLDQAIVRSWIHVHVNGNGSGAPKIATPIKPGRPAIAQKKRELITFLAKATGFSETEVKELLQIAKQSGRTDEEILRLRDLPDPDKEKLLDFCGKEVGIE